MSWPSFSEHIQNKASLYGSRVFLEDWGGKTRYTYREFAQVTSVMAWGFSRLGVDPGDRVAILHPNHTDFVLAYCSIIQAGGVAVPINTLYTPREISYILEDSGAQTLVTTRAFKSLLEEMQGGGGLPPWAGCLSRSRESFSCRPWRGPAEGSKGISYTYGDLGTQPLSSTHRELRAGPRGSS